MTTATRAKTCRHTQMRSASPIRPAKAKAPPLNRGKACAHRSSAVSHPPNPNDRAPAHRRRHSHAAAWNPNRPGCRHRQPIPLPRHASHPMSKVFSPRSPLNAARRLLPPVSGLLSIPATAENRLTDPAGQVTEMSLVECVPNPCEKDCDPTFKGVSITDRPSPSSP